MCIVHHAKTWVAHSGLVSCECWCMKVLTPSLCSGCVMCLIYQQYFSMNATLYLLQSPLHYYCKYDKIVKEQILTLCCDARKVTSHEGSWRTRRCHTVVNLSTLPLFVKQFIFFTLTNRQGLQGAVTGTTTTDNQWAPAPLQTQGLAGAAAIVQEAAGAAAAAAERTAASFPAAEGSGWTPSSLLEIRMK